MRLDITVPPGHELVATNNPGADTQYEEIDVAIRDAFDAARRQLRKLNKRQHESDKGKTHAAPETIALVTQIFRDKGYGFLKTLEGEEIYFHRNSVLHDDFDRLEIGTGVRFSWNRANRVHKQVRCRLSTNQVPVLANLVKSKSNHHWVGSKINAYFHLDSPPRSFPR